MGATMTGWAIAGQGSPSADQGREVGLTRIEGVSAELRRRLPLPTGRQTAFVLTSPKSNPTTSRLTNIDRARRRRRLAIPNRDLHAVPELWRPEVE